MNKKCLKCMSCYVEQRWYVGCDQSTSLFFTPTVLWTLFNEDNHPCLTISIDYFKTLFLKLWSVGHLQRESSRVTVKKADFCTLPQK